MACAGLYEQVRASRMMPNDLPPWYVVYQQTQRWLAAGCFTALVDDLRLLLREAKGRNRQPSAAIFDSRTLQSTPESGNHAGYDGAKRRKGSKVHAAVDTLGNLLSLLVTPANEQDRAQVGELTQRVQEATGQSVEIAFVDAGYAGDAPAEAAKEHGIRLEVVKLPEAKRGFVTAFATMGGRTLLRLDDTLPTPGAIMSGFLLLWLACTWSCLPV
jgi:transposase